MVRSAVTLATRDFGELAQASRLLHEPSVRLVILPLSFMLLCTQAFAGHVHWDHRSGAIAFSPSTGATGWSYGQPDPETAKRVAEQACGQADCTWEVTEQGAYAVLVLGAGGAHYWAWDRTLAAAQQHALELCSSHAMGCSVTRWVAS